MKYTVILGIIYVVTFVIVYIPCYQYVWYAGFLVKYNYADPKLRDYLPDFQLLSFT